MFTKERQELILSLLQEKGRVKVHDLSERFGVTDDCIRKDLKTLEKNGDLRRTYGGAILSRDYPLDRDVVDRRSLNLEKKRVIALKAQKLIRENETVFLDVSTSNIELARLLADSGIRLTIVSNMIDILQIAARSDRITPVGTGGIMYRTVNGFLGSAAIEIIGQYSFDRAFMGTTGLDIRDRTITTLGVEDGLTKKAAVKASRHTYVMMEHDKFYFNDSYRYARFDDIDGVITDEAPDPSTREVLVSSNVHLY